MILLHGQGQFMRRVRRVVRVFSYLGLLVFMTTTFGGCAASGFPARSTNESNELKALEKLFGSSTIITDYHDPTKTAPDDRKTSRNEIVAGRMALIDAHYHIFVRKFVNEKQGTDTAHDIAVMGLGSAGALLDPTGTSQILAGISAGLTGVKASIDKHYYYEKTVRALYTQMNAERKRIRLIILQSLVLDAEKYPLAQALADLDEYYYAGTFLGALTAVERDASAKDQEAEKKLDDFREATFLEDEASKLLYEYWRPSGGDANPEHQKQIQAALKEFGHEGELINYVLYADEFAELRVNIARKLNLIK